MYWVAIGRWLYIFLQAVHKVLALNWKADVVLTSGLVELFEVCSEFQLKRVLPYQHIPQPARGTRAFLALCCPRAADCAVALLSLPRTISLNRLYTEGALPLSTLSSSVFPSKSSCQEQLSISNRSSNLTFPVSLPLYGFWDSLRWRPDAKNLKSEDLT